MAQAYTVMLADRATPAHASEYGLATIRVLADTADWLDERAGVLLTIAATTKPQLAARLRTECT